MLDVVSRFIAPVEAFDCPRSHQEWLVVPSLSRGIAFEHGTHTNSALISIILTAHEDAQYAILWSSMLVHGF